MTKLLKVICKVLKPEFYCMGFEPEKCDDGCFEVMERYYTSEDAVYAFIRADRITFKAEFGDSFYYKILKRESPRF